ncbi:hypothetical protein D9758_018106 [Tetrapyrgos nigripes]|uniref:BTB domain-containing protein n=1 Tax=Tetrapyrgos nigripes TaxID=182062 RepID=A0A8H5F4B7_9AGAR|nr:hypothetical protein D9758_018106 [Tetrapyrgos nigripes]
MNSFVSCLPLEIMDPSPMEQDPELFHPTGDIIIQVENILFKVHTFLVVPRTQVLRDYLSTIENQPVESHEGSSITNPLHLSGVYVEEFRAFLDVIYDLDSILTQKKRDATYYLAVLRLSNMNLWEPGVDFAIQGINSLDPKELQPYAKIVLGVVHHQDTWVFDGVRRLFVSGPVIPQPDDKEIFKQNPSIDQCSIDWILRDGSTLLTNTITELIHHAPRFPNHDKAAWGTFNCDNHAKCVSAVEDKWKRIAKKLPLQFKAANGQWALSFEVVEHLEKFPFRSMDPRCRAQMFSILNHRAVGFYRSICCAICDKLMTLS